MIDSIQISSANVTKPENFSRHCPETFLWQKCRRGAHRGYLLFELNNKYISSSEKKISEFSRVRSTSENFYVFNSRDEIYLVFTAKKANFLFILYNTWAFSNSQGRQ